MLKTHTPLYREVLRQAWKISWHQKFMWILGLFSAFVATGGALDIVGRQLGWVFNPQPWNFDFALTGGWHWDAPSVIWGIVFFLLLLGLAAGFIFVVIRSFSTLIKTVDEFKEGNKVDLGKIWHKTHKKFWPVLLAVLVFRVLEYGFVCLSLLPLWGLILGYWTAGWMWIYPLVFLIAVSGSLICSLLVVLTSAFVVLENEKFGDSVKNAWKLFINHWLVSLEMSVLIFFINFIFSILILFVLALWAIPVVFVFFTGYFIGAPILSTIGLSIGFLFGALLVFWMAGFLGTFHTTAWTLLFKKMVSGNAVSKLVRISHRLFKRS